VFFDYVPSFEKMRLRGLDSSMRITSLGATQPDNGHIEMILIHDGNTLRILLFFDESRYSHSTMAAFGAEFKKTLRRFAEED
jgi:hypothetical protein